MKELEFIEIIKKTLEKSSHLGDDCAYLKDLGIVVTQDNLVEDVHFTRKFSSAYEIGYKAIMVNLSDVFASGANPKYLTVSLSIPKDIDSEFIKDFYNACNDIAKDYEVEIVGGDITGAEKIFISVCAIGSTENRKISSRSNAKNGDYVITTGVYGSSAAGLFALQKGIKKYPDLIEKHLKPSAKKDLSQAISSRIKTDYAMMDTSDGLADALFKIAESSNLCIKVDFDKIPYDLNTKKIAEEEKLDFPQMLLYGGEDFEMLACLNEEALNKIEPNLYTVIGRVVEKQGEHFVEIKMNDNDQKIYNLDKTFNHFKEGE